MANSHVPAPPSDEVEPERLSTLEERAGRVAQARARDGDRQPLAVEFAGSPQAGKTTTIEIVHHFFRRMDLKVWAPSEGASKRTPYHLRRDLVAYNAWALNYAISELLVAYHNVERQDLVILDRGPFDSLAWQKVLEGRGDLSRDERDIMHRFALHPRWTRLVSRVYLFTCDPEISLERENRSKLTSKGGIVMNPRTLGELLQSYREMSIELAEDYPVFEVQTSDETTPVTTSLEVAEDILRMFEERL